MLFVSVAAWLLLFAVTLPGSWRIVTGKGYDHDAIKFAFHLVAWLILAFNMRWIIAPENTVALDVLRGFSAVLALFLCVIVRFYRRFS
jgi:hypothetical protein